jgi:hypothetical protein
MRIAATGIVLLVVTLAFALCTSSAQGPVLGQGVTGGEASDPSGGMIAFSTDGTPNTQQITLIDPRTRVMSVYHIDRTSGEISLRCVRKVQWDLQMDEFNGASPSPREIRSLLQQR